MFPNQKPGAGKPDPKSKKKTKGKKAEPRGIAGVQLYGGKSGGRC